MEELRQRLLVSVPEVGELLWDLCSDVDLGSVVAEVRVGGYRVYLADPVPCRRGRGTVLLRGAVAVAVEPYEPKRVLWVRAVELPEGVGLGDDLRRASARLGRILDRFAKLYTYAPDFGKLLSEVCPDPSPRPAEQYSTVELLRFRNAFGEFALILSDAEYECGDGSTVVLRGCITAVVNGRSRVVGFARAERRGRP